MTSEEKVPSVWKNKEFIPFIFLRFSLIFALFIQSTSVAYEIFKVTQKEIFLGLIGLAEFLPILLTAFYAGQLVDKLDKRMILVRSIGCFMTASVLGPLAGGVILAKFGIEAALITAFTIMCISMVMILLISKKPAELSESESTESPMTRIKEGLRFIWGTPIILAVLSLDMFAVFFGGAESLLPAFVEKVLNQGSEAFGLLRSAHGIGSIIMMFFLSMIPSLLKGNVGPKLLGAVAMFGVCIISFGFSQNLYLCFVILMFGGAFDAISMVIRQSILQIKTPENLKGRVSSVNSIFVSSSNELGALESGIAATFLGLVPGIIFGGTMTILTVIFIAFFIKPIRKVTLE